jgi:hypothetical protein
LLVDIQNRNRSSGFFFLNNTPWTSIGPQWCPLDLELVFYREEATPETNNNNQGMALMRKQG